MKRIISSVLVLAGICFGASAAPLTPAEALQRARTSGSKKAPAAAQQQLTLSHTFSTESGAPAVYVFDQPAESGFLILSADDVATPILGYAESGNFDFENISPQMKWWLEQYADQIAYVTKRGLTPKSVPTRANAAIEPLIKSHWNQGAPYNELCPIYPATNERCVTGCVATAMAQVMNFWKYPAVGKGIANYKPNGFSSNLLLDFTQTKFDWDNMLNDYVAGEYNSTQSTAVATLMKACGYSVQMGYTSSASGAVSYNMGKALINTFNYNKNISYEQRNYYTTSEWNQMVYEELAAGRPVLYGARSEGGGHQFICDGYNDGFYHINWGWGGMSDGYFKLESLNPDSEGIGGGSGGYNFGQDIMKGVQPETVDNPCSKQMVQNGSLTATNSGMKVTLALSGGSDPGWWNWTFNTLNIKVAMAISPENNPSSITYVNVLNQNVSARTGFRSLSFNFPTSLADGKYLCRVMTWDNSSASAKWQDIRCFPGLRNTVYVIKSGNSISIENIPASTLSMLEGKVSGEVYYQCVTKVSATLKNDSETELSTTILPVMVDSNGKIMLQGSSVALTLMPGETLTKDWETVFSLHENATAPTSTTEVYLMFMDQNTNKYYDVKVPVTLKVNASGVSPSVLNFKIEGSTREAVNGVYNVWIVTDPAHIKTVFSLRNTMGYFGYPTYVYVLPYGENYVLKKTQVPNSAVKSGTIMPLKCEMSFSAGVEGEIYSIGVMYDGPYNGGNGLVLLSQSAFTIRTAGLGVDEIGTGKFDIRFDKENGAVVADGDVTYLYVYDLSGKAVPGTIEETASGKRFILDDGFTGVAVVKGVSASGDIRTLKIVR